MNPKNVLSMLCKKFNGPEYNVTSISTVEEKNFVNNLENLIKEAVNADLFIESYETLTFWNENEVPDPLIVEEEFEDDYTDQKINDKARKICIDIEYKKKAIHFWRSAKKGTISFNRVQNKFKLVKHVQQLSNKEELMNQANDFVTTVRSEIVKIGNENVYNTDQSGFSLECHTGRTLSFKGTAKVECLAQSLNSLTHTYTIQPILSAYGELKTPLLIVLQETGGCFGPIVKKNMYKADNIYVVASSSGKMTTELTKVWFEDIYLKIAGNESVLCWDSWTGQTEEKLEHVDKGNKTVKTLKIPAGTTGLIQPCDVYFFRPYKNYIKHFSDLIITHDYDINLHLRNNILKLHSLVYNQFSSPRFVNMIRYAWYKSGYMLQKPPKCDTPVDYCFKNCSNMCDYCSKIAIVKCAWCTKSICINHFFRPEYDHPPHYCTIYVK